MAFIRTIPPEEATGLLRSLYDRDVEKHGHVPNWSRAFSLRPEVLAAWRGLLEAIRASMSERRYELATIIAASRLKCSY
jgi:hypothetical protein